ncbi:DNA excision repair protein ERCC-6-like 2 [Branchiostoma belcheri]|nr:DNA excision repair protein ERCC-6-like 2 [Branchiostoma belcheri]
MSTGEVYTRLDGTTRTSDRLRIVKDFNSNPNILICLVSTTAGGLGLNFTGASVVILFEPTWNPANDQQAQDRAYRIGQRQDVRGVPARNHGNHRGKHVPAPGVQAAAFRDCSFR